MKNILWMASFLCLAAAPSLAMAQAETRRIEVRASGEVTVPADQMELPVTIVTTHEDFAAAKERNDLLVRQILALAAEQKLPRPPVKSTSANFDFDNVEDDPFSPKGQAPQQVPRPKQSKGKGEFVPSRRSADPITFRRQLTVQFQGLADATALLVKLTEFDSVRKTHEVQLSPLTTSLEDPKPHFDKARQLAVQAAKGKAVLLAKASDLKLRPALSINDESTSNHPRLGYPPASDPFGYEPVPASRAVQFVAFQGADEESAENLDRMPPAQITISVTVRIVYEATVKE